MKESYNPQNILYAWMYVHTHMYVCIYICSYTPVCVIVHAQFCYSYIIIIVQNDYTMLTGVTPNCLGTCISSVTGYIFGVILIWCPQMGMVNYVCS